MPRKPIITLLTSVALAAVLAACGGDDGGSDPGESGETPVTTEEDRETRESDETGETTDAEEEAEEAAADAAWFALTDDPSGATFELPVDTDPEKNTATIGDGRTVDLRNYSALSDDIEVGFNIIDTPGAYYSFEDGVDGVAATLGGDVVSTSSIEVAGHPAVDVEMTYGDGYIVFFQLITTDDYIVQSLASGPESKRDQVEQAYHRLNESVEVH
jgi:hypothetical protein